MAAKDYALAFDSSKISMITKSGFMEVKDQKKQKEMDGDIRKREAAKNRKIIALLSHEQEDF